MIIVMNQGQSSAVSYVRLPILCYTQGFVLLEAFLLGSGFAFAAAIQPGPLQTFLLSSVTRIGWKRTLPASFAPVLSDIPIAIVVLLLLTRVPPTFTIALRFGGGFFLIYLASTSYKQWRRSPHNGDSAIYSTPQTLLQAVVVNLLNPNPYIGWSLVLGPAVLAAWDLNPSNAAVLVISFYGTMVLVLVCTILIFGLTAFLKPATRHTLILASAVILALLGLYQLLAAVLTVIYPYSFGTA